VLEPQTLEDYFVATLINIFLTVFLSCFAIRAATINDFNLWHKKLEVEYKELQKVTPLPYSVLNELNNYNEAEVKKMIGNLRLFFSHYDAFNNKKIRFLTQQTLLRLRSEVQKKYAFMSKSNQQKIAGYMAEVEKRYALTVEREGLFGLPNDYLRVVSFDQFYDLVEKTIYELTLASGKTPSRKLHKTVLPFVDSVSEFLPAAPDFTKLLAKMYLTPNIGKQGEAPLIDHLKNAQKIIAANRGTKAHWKGLENIVPNPFDGETLHMYFMNHANSYYDTTAQVHFPAADVTSIGNVAVIFPPFMSKQLKKSDNLVVVGDGKEVEHIEWQIRQKHLNRFMVSTEGFTPVGFYEMRPMLTNVAVIMKALVDRGLKLSINPMSFPQHFTLFNEWRLPLRELGNNAYGVLHPALTHDQIVSLARKAQDYDAVCQLIRYIWFLDLTNNQTLFLSMPTPSFVEGELNKRLWIDYN
jgi:hypothetical protein